MAKSHTAARRDRRRDATPLIALSLDRRGAVPLHRQIYGQVRDAVLSGRIAPGVRLPSTRRLAAELGCARNTVLSAFDQLLSEGYLDGERGSGTYVSRVLPEQLLSVRTERRNRSRDAGRRVRQLGRRGRALLAFGRDERSGNVAFMSGVPDHASFPFDIWARLLGRSWRHPDRDALRHGATGGYLPLRRTIAQYLKAVRGLSCEAEQILITSGAQQGLDLVARVLLDPGDAVWIEEPGYLGLRGALVAAGARLVPVPVDDEGMSVTEGQRRAADARLVAVTPSHQYPLGVTMSLARRLELLDWAHANDAWILEDDYDSEYRYAGRPLAALQGLDAGQAKGSGRVIYVGTFSLVLFRAMRIGYLVLPPDLADAVGQARRSLDDYPSLVAQPALARFIEEGYFAAHVRRMRRLYAARQVALLDAAARHLAGLLSVAPDEAGLHLVADLAPDLARRMTDRDATERAAAAGVTVTPLSSFYMGPPARQGLTLGYAAVPEEAIAPAAKRLASALRS